MKSNKAKQQPVPTLEEKDQEIENLRRLLADQGREISKLTVELEVERKSKNGQPKEEELEKLLEEETQSYAVDNKKLEFKKLKQDIKESRRYRDDNKPRLEATLSLLESGKSITSEQLKQTLQEKAPANISDFMTKTVGRAVSKHRFEIVAKDNSYRLVYKPGAKGLILFTTLAGEAEALVHRLLYINGHEIPDELKDRVRITAAGGITGDYDVFAFVEGETTDDLLGELTSLIHSKTVRLMASCKTYIVVSGLSWELRDKGKGKSRPSRQST